MTSNSSTPTPDIPIGDNDRKFRPPGSPTVKISDPVVAESHPENPPKSGKMTLIWTVPPVYPSDDVDNSTKSHDFIF